MSPRSFVQALNSTGTVSLVMVSPSENFSQYLSAHSASDGIIIPADFSANYTLGKPVNVTVYGNPSQSSSAIVSGTVTGVINGFNLGYYPRYTNHRHNPDYGQFSGDQVHRFSGSGADRFFNTR